MSTSYGTRFIALNDRLVDNSEVAEGVGFNHFRAVNGQAFYEVGELQFHFRGSDIDMLNTEG
jgi:hypothetical protein